MYRYMAAMEYTAALKAQIARLSGGGATVLSALPAGRHANEEASALTTGTAGTLIDALCLEMCAQTAASAAQLATLTAAVGAMTAPGNNVVPGAPRGGPRGGPRRAAGDAAPRPKHDCKNCKRLVYHKDERCMELPANAALRREGWVSCLSVPIT